MYSKTLEDDKHGRWCIRVDCGNSEKMFGKDGNCLLFEIASISKLKDSIENVWYSKKFVINYNYPYNNGKYIFDSVEECKEEIEKSFKIFINSCK